MVATGNLVEGGKAVKIAILLIKSPSGKYVGVVGLVDSSEGERLEGHLDQGA